jgi:hypothetical protein
MAVTSARCSANLPKPLLRRRQPGKSQILLDHFGIVLQSVRHAVLSTELFNVVAELFVGNSCGGDMRFSTAHAPNGQQV